MYIRNVLSVNLRTRSTQYENSSKVAFFRFGIKYRKIKACKNILRFFLSFCYVTAFI